MARPDRLAKKVAALRAHLPAADETLNPGPEVVRLLEQVAELAPLVATEDHLAGLDTSPAARDLLVTLAAAVRVLEAARSPERQEFDDALDRLLAEVGSFGLALSELERELSEERTGGKKALSEKARELAELQTALQQANRAREAAAAEATRLRRSAGPPPSWNVATFAAGVVVALALAAGTVAWGHQNGHLVVGPLAGADPGVNDVTEPGANEVADPTEPATGSTATESEPVPVVIEAGTCLDGGARLVACDGDHAGEVLSVLDEGAGGCDDPAAAGVIGFRPASLGLAAYEETVHGTPACVLRRRDGGGLGRVVAPYVLATRGRLGVGHCFLGAPVVVIDCRDAHHWQVVATVPLDGDERDSCQDPLDRYLRRPATAIGVASVAVVRGDQAVCALVHSGGRKAAGSRQAQLELGAPLRFTGCLNHDGSLWQYVDCDDPHDGEVVGVRYDAGFPNNNERQLDQCIRYAEAYLASDVPSYEVASAGASAESPEPRRMVCIVAFDEKQARSWRAPCPTGPGSCARERRPG